MSGVNAVSKPKRFIDHQQGTLSLVYLLIFNVCESQASCLSSEAEALQKCHPSQNNPLNRAACALNHTGLFYLRSCKYKSPHVNELFIRNVSVML